MKILKIIPSIILIGLTSCGKKSALPPSEVGITNYVIITNEIPIYSIDVKVDSSCKESIIKTIMKLDSSLDIGLTYNEYKQLLTDYKVDIDYQTRSLPKPSEDDFINQIYNIFNVYEYVLREWKRDIDGHLGGKNTIAVKRESILQLKDYGINPTNILKMCEVEAYFINGNRYVWYYVNRNFYFSQMWMRAHYMIKEL